MTARQTASLAFKLTGIVCVIWSIPFLQTTLSVFTLDQIQAVHRSVLVALQAVPLLLLVSIGSVLILKSDALSEWAFREPGNVSTAAESSEVQAIALSVAGAVIVALAVPDLSKIAWNFVFLRMMRDPVERETPWLFEGAASRFARETWGHLVGAVVQLALGLALFLRSRAIAVWWDRLNRPGGNEQRT